MMAPGVILSVLAVLVAWLMGPPRPSRPGQVSLAATGRGGPGASGFKPPLVAAMLWGTVAVLADPLAGRLAVTAPTVRVAAGVGLLVVSISRCWAAIGPGSPPWTSPPSLNPVSPPAMPADSPPSSFLASAGETAEAMLRGPVRVEVGVAVWSLSLDHGPRTAALTVLALSALSALSARALGKVALTVTGTVVAVLLTINGVLGL